MKKNKDIRNWFLVMSDWGYFSGLSYGGVPQWSLKEADAKPLDHINKFHTLQSICHNLELIYEYKNPSVS